MRSSMSSFHIIEAGRAENRQESGAERAESTGGAHNSHTGKLRRCHVTVKIITKTKKQNKNAEKTPKQKMLQ